MSDDIPLQKKTVAAAAAAESDDDDILEVVVKSQETMLREKFSRAKAAGNIFTVGTTMAATAQATTMRSTFQSISSAVTAMRNGTSSALQERQGIVLASNSAMVPFDATRMILDAAGQGKISVAPGEQPNGRKVRLAIKPFAQGGLRNVYRMEQDGESKQVAKESRHTIKYNERLVFHTESTKCQARAMVYAKAFNKKVKKIKHKGASKLKRITFLSAEVYRLNDSRYPGGFRYLAVEPEMEGEYEKWNSNNGYVNKSGSTRSCHVAQAFRYVAVSYCANLSAV